MNRPPRPARRYNGFTWKITWRCEEKHRDGTRMARTWTVYMYRADRPHRSELDGLRKRYPQCEFRIRRIGEAN